MGKNIYSEHKKRIFFNPYLPIVRAEFPDSEFENFSSTVANLPQNATERKRLLKYVPKFVSLEKCCVFERNLIFFKACKGGKSAIEDVSNGIIS